MRSINETKKSHRERRKTSHREERSKEDRRPSKSKRPDQTVGKEELDLFKKAQEKAR